MAQIAQQFIKPDPSAAEVEALARRAHATETSPRLPSGLFFAQSLAMQFLGFQFKVSLDLFGEVFVCALLAGHAHPSSDCAKPFPSRISPTARASRRHCPVFS